MSDRPEIMALHAAISRRDWHATEVAANKLRDDEEASRQAGGAASRAIKARDGIEAQRGLNDVWPGDDYPAPASPPQPDALKLAETVLTAISKWSDAPVDDPMGTEIPTNEEMHTWVLLAREALAAIRAAREGE